MLGGLGVIGKATIEESAATDRHDLVVADTRPDPAAHHVLDVRDGDALNALVAEVKPDAIVNLAALVSFPAIRADLCGAADINLLGTLRTLEAAREAGVSKVVIGSSKAVYGHIDGPHGDPTYEPVPESHPLTPRNPYDALKVAAEIMGREFGEQHEIDVIALRFGTIYGPGKNARHGYSSLFSRFVEAAVQGTAHHVPHGGDQGDDLLYVRDCARAVLAAAQAPAGTTGSFNIATGRCSRVSEFVATLTSLEPAAEVSIGAGMNYAGETVSYRSVLDIASARDVLGFISAYDLEAGITDYLATERRRLSSTAT